MRLTHHYAVVAPGLEAVAALELEARGFSVQGVGQGGIGFMGAALAANRTLAIPTRVLTRLARFPAHNFDQLRQGLAKVPLSGFGGLTLDISCRKSALYHTGAILERLAPLVPAGPTTLKIRLDRDRCTVSVDTSGDPLYQRGWRLESGPAPLRETLAAGILALAGWRPGEALVDPMCGSGTFLIEAATAAAGLWPGRLRRFAGETWLPEEPPPPPLAAVPTLIAGGDRSRAALEACRHNAERAGVTLTLTRQDALRTVAPAPTGLLICNPPYGRRVEEAEAAFDQLGALFAGPFTAWRGAILCPEPRFARRLRRPVRDRFPLNNGGIALELLLL